MSDNELVLDDPERPSEPNPGDHVRHLAEQGDDQAVRIFFDSFGTVEAIERVWFALVPSERRITSDIKWEGLINWAAERARRGLRDREKNTYVLSAGPGIDLNLPFIDTSYTSSSNTPNGGAVTKKKRRKKKQGSAARKARRVNRKPKKRKKKK